jgi:hypothetical protein
MAAASGVSAFGTHALLEALERRGQVAAGTTAAALVRLRDEYCVDMPFDPAWTAATAAHLGFEGGPALVALSRGASWHDLPATLAAWQELIVEASDVDPALPSRWVYAASIGVLHLAASSIDAGDSSFASELVATLAGAGILAADDAESTAAILHGCADACATEGLPDPTPRVLQSLRDSLVGQYGEAQGTRKLALLCQQVTDEHRAILQDVLFGHLDRPDSG